MLNQLPEEVLSKLSWRGIAEKAWPIASAKRNGDWVSDQQYAALVDKVKAKYSHLSNGHHHCHDGL